MPPALSTLASSFSPRVKRAVRFHPQPNRRATLRDLYVSGLVSIFRRDSILRVWEPLRETPRQPDAPRHLSG